MKRFGGKLVGWLLGFAALFYAIALVLRAGEGSPAEATNVNAAFHETIAVFGATGTIGDGLLKAAMNDPDVERIHVITRRPSPRAEAGVDAGRVTMTIHRDYGDFSAIREILAEVDAVYWAIGLSAVGMEEDAYREIHATYPLQLVREWLDASSKANRSFHYVSGAGAKAESRMMWAREKARAESELAKAAQGTGLRVVSYRPSLILPTEAEAHLGHRIMHTVFAPLKAAVAAEGIGEAMLEVSVRGAQLPNGTILENADILGYSQAYGERQGRE